MNNEAAIKFYSRFGFEVGETIAGCGDRPAVAAAPSQPAPEAAITAQSHHYPRHFPPCCSYYKRLDPPDAVLLRRRLQPAAGDAAAA